MGKTGTLILVLGLGLVAIWFLSKQFKSSTVTNVTKESETGSLVGGATSIFDRWMDYKTDSDKIAAGQNAGLAGT